LQAVSRICPAFLIKRLNRWIRFRERKLKASEAIHGSVCEMMRDLTALGGVAGLGLLTLATLLVDFFVD
jgi:hypothetical protein